jgi:hypothetical protein
LPLAWLVRQGKQGHFPEALPIPLIEQVKRRIPAGARVGVLGDGECDGTTLQQTMQDYHWSSGVRTGKNITVRGDGETFRCDTVASCLKPGPLVAFTDVRVTPAA